MQLVWAQKLSFYVKEGKVIVAISYLKIIGNVGNFEADSSLYGDSTAHLKTTSIVTLKYTKPSLSINQEKK